jgi:hypothetical protein
MGNKQSAAALKTQNVTDPPLVCDLKCQKEKDLALLKTNLDNADKEKDPDGYEKARIAYYTLLNGQGWLQAEKQKIAKEEVEPLLTNYRTEYDALKGEKKSQSMFTKLMNHMKSQNNDTDFLNKELLKEKDKADVLDRMNELNAGTPVSNPSPEGLYAYIPFLIDLIIVLLAFTVIYLIYSKFMRSKPIVTSSVPAMAT